LIPGNDEYIFIFETIIAPILREFKPELVFISAGFDSALYEFLGDCALTNDGYAYMT
jgi:histone deacetylase 6